MSSNNPYRRPPDRPRRRLTAAVLTIALTVLGLVMVTSPARAAGTVPTIAYITMGNQVWVHDMVGNAPIDFFRTDATGASASAVALTVTPDGTRAYVANENSYAVSVVDTATDGVITNITVGGAPQALAVSPDGTRLYVVKVSSNSVSVINTATNEVIDTITVPDAVGGLSGVAFGPDSTRAYVPHNTERVSVINVTTNEVIDTIFIGANSGPRGVAVSPNSPRLIVTNVLGRDVSVINTNTNEVERTIVVGSGPNDVVFSLDGAHAYVANKGDGSVSIIDTTTNQVETPFFPGAGTADVALSPDGAHLYAISPPSRRMVVYDTTTNMFAFASSSSSTPVMIAAFPWPAPTVTGVSPSSGPVTGGNTITVTGTRLNKGTITFGAAGPASGGWCTTTSCTVTAPPGPPGVVDLRLTTPGGTITAGQYTYLAVPVVTGVSPSIGPVAGGNPVTITGTDLAGATGITFGPGNNATDVTCTATSCTTVAPAGNAGEVHVQVTTPGGTSATSDADRYTYAPVPVVTSVSPSSGPAAGGNAVTITGTNLEDATEVTFGPGRSATDLACTATSCSVTAPAGPAGTVHVQVTTPSGTSATSDADRYTYLPAAPVVTAIHPDRGPTAGGTKVTITGTDLADATEITFGPGNNATDVSCTATSCTAVAPPGAGTVQVRVTTAGGTSGSAQYTYSNVPVVTAIHPSSGPVAGGNTVTITGTDLAGATGIAFGAGNNATDVSCTATLCTAVAPAGNAGEVHVQVTTPGGTSATSDDNRYTYVSAPTVTAVSPNAGPLAGGNTVTITGTDLAGATITFGSGNNATDVSCTATSCTAVVPAGSIGTLHVQATTIGGTSATSVDNRYTYVSAPTVTAVSPNAGPLAGGNTVTIT
ncbi:IPT/TIG domain-containing protein, partial [Polymorphospora sp. NPDC050346]|uniref:IPT/TIG domain-containing protein n=1 Tax=Polymorphospora sp. NPDC050346 TaxID=3155780 RepID=UPI0033EE1723